tara:strand:+ start:3641 stop:3895 length:255 start_codon:yes stop_codon:yes gene_type:complete
MIQHDEESGYYYFECPHCNSLCQVHKTDIRCTIFRHAVYKKDLTFVNPHASEKECKKWVSEGTVYGCGKPFKFDGKKVEICGYI